MQTGGVAAAHSREPPEPRRHLERQDATPRLPPRLRDASALLSDTLIPEPAAVSTLGTPRTSCVGRGAALRTVLPALHALPLRRVHVVRL